MKILFKTVFLLFLLCVSLYSEDTEVYNHASALADAKTNNMIKIEKASAYAVKNNDSEVVNVLIANDKYEDKYALRNDLFNRLLNGNYELAVKALIFLFKDDDLWFKKVEMGGELRSSKIVYENTINRLLVRCLKKDYGTKYVFETLEIRKKILAELEQALKSYVNLKEGKEVYNQLSAVADANSKSLTKIEDACVYAIKNEDSEVMNILFNNKTYGDKHELRAQLFQTIYSGKNEFILKTLIFLFKDDNLWVKFEEKLDPNTYTKEFSEGKLNDLLAKYIKVDVDKKYTFDTQESRKIILIELEKALATYTKENEK